MVAARRLLPRKHAAARAIVARAMHEHAQRHIAGAPARAYAARARVLLPLLRDGCAPREQLLLTARMPDGIKDKTYARATARAAPRRCRCRRAAICAPRRDKAALMQRASESMPRRAMARAPRIL